MLSLHGFHPFCRLFISYYDSKFATPLQIPPGELRNLWRDSCRFSGIARPEFYVAGILLNFGSLTGVSGSASAERRFQPQKGYSPSPGCLHISSIFARLPNFGLDTELLVSFGGMNVRCLKHQINLIKYLSSSPTSGGNGASSHGCGLGWPLRTTAADRWKIVRGSPDSPGVSVWLSTEPAPNMVLVMIIEH